MENTWTYHGEEPIKIKKYLKSLGMGHRLFNDIKKGDGEFLVDGRRVRPTTMVLPNQPLTVKMKPELADPAVKVSHDPLNIVYEDDNWIVVNKAAGLVSIPGPGEDNGTVVNCLLGHLTEENDENQRPHLVTRLDQYTAGLLLVAKHRLASSMVSQQVEKHTMIKEYYALVAGQMPQNHGMITDPIKRVAGSARRIIDPSGQSAATEYWQEKSNGQLSLLRLRLHSGRTHQIRVHLSSRGCPILGDHLYDGPLDKLKHQALAAVHLQFKDPFTEKTMDFKIELPDQMAAIVNEI